MFLSNSHRGYTRDGQQRAAGRFLIVFAHNQYKWADENGTDWRNVPKTITRELFAHVCHVSMSQLGHFMMGTSRTMQVSKAYGDHPAPNNLVLSGTYGDDGLPCDYEDLTPKSRAKLIPVPAELTETFWRGGGHNEAGSEAYAMRDWALATFPERKRGVR
jgi:hypothetical protein